MREAYAIGFSVPSSRTCDSTAPTPYGDSSLANDSFLEDGSAPGYVLLLAVSSPC